jgi:hypothetical protein
MKTLQCDLCDYEVQAKTFEDWMEALKPHYAETHTDFMKLQSEKSPEEQQESMKQWMRVNHERFNAA